MFVQGRISGPDMNEQGWKLDNEFIKNVQADDECQKRAPLVFENIMNQNLNTNISNDEFSL